LKLPAIELPASLAKIPGLSRFVKPKAHVAGASAHAQGGAKGAVKGHGASVAPQEQQALRRLDLTMKGFAVLAVVLIVLALYTVFAQNGLNKAILTAAPPTIDLSELAAAGPASEEESGSGDKAAKAGKASTGPRVKLPEGTDARLDFAFEQIANFENTRSEAILRASKATVAGVAPGSPAARAGFVPGDLILGVDGEQAGFVWDALRKLTSAGKASVLIEVQRGPEILRGELFAPEGELLTSANSGLFIQIPEGYRFVGENDRRDLRNSFTRSYLEGLAGDERLAYATSLAILGANLMKRGVAQTKVRPDDSNWLKTEFILSDHHNKFNKVLTRHTTQIEGMQAQLQAGFVKVGAYLLACLLAAVAAVAAAVQYNRHLAEHAVAQVRAQFQGLRAEVDQWIHAQKALADHAAKVERTSGLREGAGDAAQGRGAPLDRDTAAGDALPGLASAGGSASGASAKGLPSAPVNTLSLAELAARVALSGDGDEDNPRAGSGSLRPPEPSGEVDPIAKVPFSGGAFQPGAETAANAHQRASTLSAGADALEGAPAGVIPHTHVIPHTDVIPDAGVSAPGGVLFGMDKAVAEDQAEAEAEGDASDGLSTKGVALAGGNPDAAPTGDRPADGKVASGDVA